MAFRPTTDSEMFDLTCRRLTFQIQYITCMIWCLESIMIVCSRWSKPAEIPTSSKTKPFFLNSQFFPSFFEITRPIRQLQSSFYPLFDSYDKHFYSFKFILSPLFRCYLYGLNPPSLQSSLSFYFLDKCQGG